MVWLPHLLLIIIIKKYKWNKNVFSIWQIPSDLNALLLDKMSAVVLCQNYSLKNSWLWLIQRQMPIFMSDLLNHYFKVICLGTKQVNLWIIHWSDSLNCTDSFRNATSVCYSYIRCSASINFVQIFSLMDQKQKNIYYQLLVYWKINVTLCCSCSCDIA